MTPITTARSPGKLILSGEHSVVYGAPAIVAAVARYTTVRFTPIIRGDRIEALINDFPNIAEYPLRGITKLKEKLDSRFEQFMSGKRPIWKILNRPEDLVIYTLAHLAQHIPLPGPRNDLPLPNPGRLHSHSDLPLGAGMGSSAAAIAATLILYEHLLNHPLTLEQRFERIRFCERLQHGKGSAIDAAAVTYGGIQMLRDQHPTALQTSLNQCWYTYLHGIPCVSTGETVSHVRSQHGNDAALWKHFTTLTEAFETTLQQAQDPRDLIKENHRLLTHIGVVPKEAANLIAQIEASGGAAKISGAGAHYGEKGGMILIYHPDHDTLLHLLPKVEALHISHTGAEIINTA